MRMAAPGLQEQVWQNTCGPHHPPSFGAAFCLGHCPQPNFPLWFGEAQGGHTLAATPHSAPSRKRPLDRGRQAGLYDTDGAGGQGLQVTLLTSADTAGGAQGRRPLFFFSLF